MKKTVKFLSLFLCVLLLFVGCVQQEKPPADTSGADTSDSVSVTDDSEDIADDTQPTDTDETQNTEPIEDDFDPSADTRYGTVVNIDCDAIMYMYNANGQNWKNAESAEQMCIDWFNSHYKDAGVSDLLYNIDTVVPTESRKEWFDFYIEALATGAEMDATTENFGKVTNELYNELNVHPYDIWIDLCKENGINPWLSFRMNDTHAPALGYYDQDFRQIAEQNGWLIGAEAGWGSYNKWCYDYSVPEVREFYLTYIDEVLGDFDVYGIELDFQRNIHCFKENSKDNCQYMDLFMEELNEIISKYEEQYGHEIKIMARIARDIDQNMYFGFDVRNWAMKDWIDVVVPSSSNYGHSDSRMPITAWKEALRDYEKVEVYAGLECAVFQSGDTTYYHSILSLAGYTSMYLQQGADKIYLYNIFNANATTYKICSSLAAALKCAKRVYPVVGQDIVPLDCGVELDDPLPMQIRGNQEGTIVIDHGRLNAEKDTYIYVGVSKMALDEEKLAAANIKVTYNGVECEYKGITVKAFVKTDSSFGYMLSFKVPEEAYKTSVSGEITISTEKTIRVLYLELMNGPPALG